MHNIDLKEVQMKLSECKFIIPGLPTAQSRILGISGLEKYPEFGIPELQSLLEAVHYVHENIWCAY